MQADCQYARVVPERSLDTIAVMHVNVDIGDAFRSLSKQPGNSNSGVVVDAKAARVAAHRVMQPAGNAAAVQHVTGPDCAHRGERSSGYSGRGFMHASEDRVIWSA